MQTKRTLTKQKIIFFINKKRKINCLKQLILTSGKFNYFLITLEVLHRSFSFRLIAMMNKFGVELPLYHN